ncbi:hypothetical protein T10_9595 [Trichinella papuae]|uniref:Uncharacterized protein n=1 Tax=Trichinella papuae TaxID=268474 RepID=A0A0V1MQ80_9BILA|nr:hypothetical protein T10_9595 [Trichinella papuae]
MTRLTSEFQILSVIHLYTNQWLSHVWHNLEFVFLEDIILWYFPDARGPSDTVRYSSNGINQVQTFVEVDKFKKV